MKNTFKALLIIGFGFFFTSCSKVDSGSQIQLTESMLRKNLVIGLHNYKN